MLRFTGRSCSALFSDIHLSCLFHPSYLPFFLAPVLPPPLREREGGKNRFLYYLSSSSSKAARLRLFFSPSFRGFSRIPVARPFSPPLFSILCMCVYVCVFGFGFTRSTMYYVFLAPVVSTHPNLEKSRQSLFVLLTNFIYHFHSFTALRRREKARVEYSKSLTAQNILAHS